MPMRTMAPLAGRDDELADIRERISGLSGGGGTVLVTGDIGMGKSTLMAAVAAVAAELDGDTAVLQVSCASVLGSSAPFAAVTTALRQMYRRGGLRRLLDYVPPLAAVEVGRLVPEVAVPNINLPELANERDRATRSIEAFVQVATASARAGQRTLLLVDDAHWIDEDSFAVLDRVAMLAPSAPLLVVVSYRADEMDQRRELKQAMRRVRMAAHAHHDLEPLGAAAVAKVAGWHFGRPSVAPKLARWLHQETAGNPFHLTEALRATVESGVSLPALAHNPQLAVPSSVVELLRTRIGPLNDDERAALQLLSVTTADATIDRVVAVGQMDAERAARALESLVASGLAATTEEGRWQVAHDQVRLTVTEMDAPEDIRAAHLRLADYLEAGTTSSEDELAHHLTMAGEGHRAIGHLLAAARAARRQAALFTAHSRFQQVRAEMSSRPLPAEWKFGVLAEHENLLGAIPLRDEQHATLEEMATLVGDDSDRAVQVLVRRSGLLFDGEGNLAEASQVAEQAGNLIDTVKDPSLQCEVHLARGRMSAERLDPSCREPLEAAVKSASTPRQQATALTMLGWALHFACEADPASLDTLAQAEAIARDHDLIDLRAVAARHAGTVLGSLGRAAEADARLREAVQLAEQVGARHSAVASMKVQCLNRWFSANFDELDKLQVFVADQAVAIGEKFIALFVGHMRAYTRAAAGDVDVARVEAERVMEHFVANRQPHAANVAHTLVVIALNDDDPELAAKHADEGMDLANGVHDPGVEALSWSAVAEVAMYREDADEVLRALSLAEKVRDAVMGRANAGFADSMRAWAFAANGDIVAARRAIGETVAAVHDGSDRCYVIRWNLARACALIGDDEGAARHHEAAREWAERILKVFSTDEERDVARSSWPMREIVYGG